MRGQNMHTRVGGAKQAKAGRSVKKTKAKAAKGGGAKAMARGGSLAPLRIKKTKIGRVRLQGRMQKGLFANETIATGDFVARMDPKKVKILSRRTYKRRLAESPELQGDFAIEVQGNKHATDWHTHTAPRWYRLNHSALRPNVEFEWVGKKRGGYIAWRAIKNIRKGAELKFDYGAAPIEWG